MSDHLPVGVVLDLVDTTVATHLPDGVTCAGNTMALLTSDEHRSPTVARRAEARRSAREQVEARPVESVPTADEGAARTSSVGGATEVSPGGSP